MADNYIRCRHRAITHYHEEGGAGALVVRGSGTHAIYTGSGTNLFSLDSANGMITTLAGTRNRGTLRTKVLQSTLGGTTPGYYLNIAHGVSSYRNIMSWDVSVYEDSIGVWLCPGYNRTVGLAPGTVFEITSTNASWYVPPTSGNLKNSGDSIRWIIRYCE